jgi:phosphopantothenoylcysteine decarboxylase/phosphopantothenate--cysteine ligase
MGYQIVDPDSGELACGTYGAGRLADNEKIVQCIKKAVLNEKKSQLKTEHRNLQGKKVVITMGATREKLDPVRYLSNQSSGKMGLALARQALNHGMQVELITTIPINETWAEQVNITRVESHAEMHNAVIEKFSMRVSNETPADALIMVAAVADYKPVTSAEHKIKKDNEDDSNLIFEFEKTTDILQEVSRIKAEDQVVIGFSVETENALEHARDKILRKGLDIIVVNSPDAFGVDMAEVSLVFGPQYAGHIPVVNHLGNIEKHLIAENILQALTKVIEIKSKSKGLYPNC